MKKKAIIAIVAVVLIAAGGITGYAMYKNGAKQSKVNTVNIEKNQLEKIQTYNFTYKVDPATLEITVDYNGDTQIASKALPAMKVSDYKVDGDTQSWVYPDKHMKVTISKKNNYLDVNLTSLTDKANSFEFPNVSAKDYTLPIDEGKYVPADNTAWKQYLNNYTDTTLEMFSMPFFALNTSNYAMTYIMTNPYNNNISFNTTNNIDFNIDHDYTSINKNKNMGYRIYVGPNDASNIAKTYKDYVVSQGDFETLAQKAQANPNVNKLIGAPQIYLWNNRVIEPDNINWQNLIKDFNPQVKAQMISVLQKLEGEQEQIAAVQAIGTTNYEDKYDKNLITSAITSVCESKDFYNKDIFKNTTPQIDALLSKGINNLDDVQVIQLNEMLLKNSMPNVFAPVNEWANSATTDVINDMHNSGIDSAWIGLNDWRQAYLKPQMVTAAVNDGYLMAPYDSYNSIQDPGSIDWDTADFQNKALYNDATMENKDGQKRVGFKNQGRILNATLSMPSVKNRVARIIKNIPNFNSWFIDCDAAGQVFNDYSPNHISTKEQIVAARLDRLNYIGKDKKLVVGSEGGHDYAVNALDYAQGIASQPFSWMDKSQMQNKQSPYYTGGYYSKTGGVPPKFGMQVQIPQVYQETLYNPAYTIPLYKTVYNNAVVSTYHWLWGTLKVKGDVQDNFLHDILYNVPALYHLDAQAWQNEKSVIVENNKVFAPFSKLVTNQEMTDFKILTPDRLVQMTQYGNDVKVIANFSNQEVTELGYKIPAKSLIILEGSKVIRYTPPNYVQQS
ncbi:MAG: glycoside hydrolase [Sarcina sp.]